MAAMIRKVSPILKENDVIKAGLFGSFARGDAKKSSDVDIIVKFKGKKSLLHLIRLENILKKKLGKKIDLLTYNSLHPLLKRRILREEVKIL